MRQRKSEPADEDTLLNDKRPILSIYFRDGKCWYEANAFAVIEVYPEPGDYGDIPWIRVKQDGRVTCRMNANRAEIFYG